MARPWCPRHLEQHIRLCFPGDSPLFQLLAPRYADYCCYHELQCTGHGLRLLLQHTVLCFLGEEVLFWANHRDQQQVKAQSLEMADVLRFDF